MNANTSLTATAAGNAWIVGQPSPKQPFCCLRSNALGHLFPDPVSALCELAAFGLSRLNFSSLSYRLFYLQTLIFPIILTFPLMNVNIKIFSSRIYVCIWGVLFLALEVSHLSLYVFLPSWFWMVSAAETHGLPQSLFKKKQKRRTSAPLEKIARPLFRQLPASPGQDPY